MPGIHSAMPTHKDVGLKLALNNYYLFLNNEHKLISFNFFRTFDYSLSLIFLVALIQLAKQN